MDYCILSILGDKNNWDIIDQLKIVELQGLTPGVNVRVFTRTFLVQLLTHLIDDVISFIAELQQNVTRM